MIRWNRKSRTLILQLPRGRDYRLLMVLLGLVIINVLVSYIDLPLAEDMKHLDEGVVAFFRAITKAGDSKYYLIPLALILPFVLAARQAMAVGSVRRILSWSGSAIFFIFSAVAVSGLLINILKIIIGRTRPKLWFNEGLYGFAPFTFTDSAYHSFPSGHSNTIVCFALALSFFVPRLRVFLVLLAFSVAFSRVVITAHFLSDILVGGLLGLATTYWLRDVFTRRGWVFVKRRGEYHLQAPGYLLGQKIKALLWDCFGLSDGARGKLP